MSDFFNILNDISFNKKMILTDENQRGYSPYIINEIFSRSIDGIVASEMANRMSELPKEIHYKYMMNSLSKRKRFAKMPKYQKPEHFDLIQEYYKYSQKKTQEVFDILTPDQIEAIVKMCDKGGVK